MFERIAPMPGGSTPVERVLSRFDRDQLASFIEVAIGLLDLADGDPEREDDDPDSEVENQHADVAWIEWTARGRYKEGRFGGERLARDRHGNTLHEDDEDDDPGGGDVVDEPHDAEQDTGIDDEGEREIGVLMPVYGTDQTAGPINEEDAIREHFRRQREADEREEEMRQHRRIASRINAEALA